MPRTVRILAEALCDGFRVMSSDTERRWIIALRREIDQIENDLEALIFAVHGIFGLLPRTLTSRFRAALSVGASTKRTRLASCIFDGLANPRMCGLAALSTTALTGLAFMVLMEAPGRYFASNSAALSLSIAVLLITWRKRQPHQINGDLLALALSSCLLFTSLFGISADGATRWLTISGVPLQTSLIVVPALLIIFARAQTPLATMCVALTAFALSAQPDRAMSAALLCGLGALALIRLNISILIALVCSAAAFWATYDQYDTLQEAEHVTDIFSTSFEIHLVAGMIVVLAAGLLLLPAASLVQTKQPQYTIATVFAVSWGAILIAAASGTYPTPVIGYGASSIFGYALCIAVLPSHGAYARRSQQFRHWRDDRLERDSFA